MQAAKSILFVSHKADRSGAPILLYNIIKAFKNSSDISFQILLLQDGDLADDFKKLGATHIWDTRKKEVPSPLIKYLAFQLSRIVFIFQVLRILFRIRKTSLVFFNTITNGHIHKKLLFLKCRYVCYVHELEVAIHGLTSNATLQTTLHNTDHFFAVSHAVKENLIQQHSIEEKKISVVPTPVPITTRSRETFNARETFIKEHGLYQDVIIVGIIGAAEWRKGFDLLVPLLKIYSMLFPESNVHFIWKGFKNEHYNAFEKLYDIKKSDVSARLSLLPHDNKGMETMSAFDIHLLLSREDPYPLVVLEAASFGIPTVCFEGAGGACEFVETDAGFCVPYGDLLQMAKALHRLAASTALRTQMGIAAQHKLGERHNETEAISCILKETKSLLQGSVSEMSCPPANPMLST